MRIGKDEKFGGQSGDQIYGQMEQSREPMTGINHLKSRNGKEKEILFGCLLVVWVETMKFGAQENPKTQSQIRKRGIHCKWKRGEEKRET